VGTDRVVRCDAPTTLAVAELDERGTAGYRFYIDGTSAAAFSTRLDVTSGILFAGGLGLVLQPMAETIEAIVTDTGDEVTVVVDVNARPTIVSDREQYVARVNRVLRHADVVKVSDEDLGYLAPGQPAIDAARRLLAAGPRAVLLTAGRQGVVALTTEGERQIEVAPIDVVDTIGAGDAFSGGFMAYWTAAGLGSGELASIGHVAHAVEAASTVAGVVCSRRGADPPWRDELPADWVPDHAD
jgi:fructokinase